jgi:hypothetical protein
VTRRGKARQAKEKCSFLKKRTKKLLPGASHDSPRPVPHFKPWRSRAANEGKVFWFFFSKKNFLLPFSVAPIAIPPSLPHE